jgi:hypothetical protein
MNLDTARATLDCARADVDEETDRMKVLDGKLTNIAAFSGLALSIGGAVGSSVVVSGRLGLGFTIALGAVLSIAVSLLLARAILALSVEALLQQLVQIGLGAVLVLVERVHEL